MLILTPEEQRAIEMAAIQMGYEEETLMEESGKGIAEATKEFLSFHKLPPVVGLLVGKGKNGGDAFTAGSYLLSQGIQVQALQAEPLEKSSSLCQKQAHRFLQLGGTLVTEFSSLTHASLLLDGLFGTGFRGALKPPYRDLISTANKSGLPILALDIPSGLNGETGQVESIAIQAVATLCIGFPKTGFFFERGWEKVGCVKFIPLQLPPSLYEGFPGQLRLITHELSATQLPPLLRMRHKYQSGYVAGVAGSVGMEGAAMLSALGALRGGAGLVRLFHPKEATLSSQPLEILKHGYTLTDSHIVGQELARAKALFLGPGLGRMKETSCFLHSLSSSLTQPTVVDADALYHFSLSPFPLPQETLFTPHRGELSQLLHTSLSPQPSLAELALWRSYAEQQRVTLLIKGAISWVVSPGQPIWVNAMGDPSMATAGSGDLLTGLLAALLAQGLLPRQAATLGCYIHGLAGRLAATKLGSDRGLIASDLVDTLPRAISRLLSPLNRPNLLWV